MTEQVAEMPVPKYFGGPLRVKIKSLADEAKVIRHEERRSLAKAKAAKDTKHKLFHHRQYMSMCVHRIQVVRREARLTNLAYAFLKGRPYAAVENRTVPGNSPLPYADKIASIAQRVGQYYNITGLPKTLVGEVEFWIRGLS